MYKINHTLVSINIDITFLKTSPLISAIFRPTETRKHRAAIKYRLMKLTQPQKCPRSLVGPTGFLFRNLDVFCPRVHACVISSFLAIGAARPRYIHARGKHLNFANGK